jgi:hypothetical protein
MSGEGLISSRSGWESVDGVRRMRRGTVICPVCDYDAQIHGSERVTPLVTTLWCRCTNLLCGMTWRMQIAFEHVISPSGMAHPHLALPGAPATPASSADTTGPPGTVAALVPDPDVIHGLGDGGEDEAKAA